MLKSLLPTFDKLFQTYISEDFRKVSEKSRPLIFENFLQILQMFRIKKWLISIRKFEIQKLLIQIIGQFCF